MCTQLTNRAINVRTRIEKDKIVALFALSAFFICLSSNLMKKVTKNVKWSNIYVDIHQCPLGWVKKVGDNEC